MNIQQLYNGNAGRNLSYIIDDGKRAIAVDPYRSELIIDYLQKTGLKLEAIVNTHDHYDHICGNSALQDYCGCRVLAHPDTDLDHPGDGSLLATDEVNIVYTPGHTMNHLSLFIVSSHNQLISAVICGDTLFSAGVGNCRNGGDVDTLYHTLTKHFYQLPAETRIYPGHEYWRNNLNFSLSLENNNLTAQEILSQLDNDPTLAPISTIAIERQVNPFFRLANHRLADESDLETFRRLRHLRDNW